MVESVSDQKVEDMLSSVRRLVSSELPRNQRPQLQESASALVLTEAQRVEPKPPMQGQRGLTLEERIAELEAAVAGQTNDWEPDGSEDQEEHRPDRIVYRPSRPRDEEEARRPLRLSEIALIETGPAHDEDEAPSDGEAVEVAFQHEDQTPDVEGDGRIEQDASTAADEPEPDTDPSPPAELAGDPFADAIARDVAAVVAEMSKTASIEENDFRAALAEAVRDPAETRGVERTNAASGDSVSDDADEPQETFETASEETVVIDEPEQVDAEAETTEETTSDDAGVEEPSANEVAAAIASTTAGDGTSREERAQDLAGDDNAGDENLLALTPQQLRLLISSMIRDELQGELGERITRNVRKLVRQEVHRALSVRDLE